MRTFMFNSVYLNNSYTLLSSLEHSPTIKDYVDKVEDDYYCEENSVEECESRFQKEVIEGLFQKENLKEHNIELLISGDLQNQIFASNYNASKFNFPFLGIYSACASYVEGLIIASSLIEGKFLKNSLVVTSSHNLVSERQFRYPIEYGAIRKFHNSFTSTGAVSSFLSTKKSNVKINTGTIGRVVDLNHTDANDMGAAMAPACAEVIYEHLNSIKKEAGYYDLILTGDLGVFGLKIMKEYYKEKYKKELENTLDSATLLYGVNEESDFAGGSGPTCLPLVFNSKILKEKKYKRILLVATGCLHSATSVNLTLGMPGIAHVLGIEVL